MRRILQIVACVSFSLSCYSMGTDINFGINTETNTKVNIGDSFLKISNDEYVQYHYEPIASPSKASVGRITSTHVRTYGGDYHNSVWNIQTIIYA